jgi:hypothetical protein
VACLCGACRKPKGTVSDKKAMLVAQDGKVSTASLTNSCENRVLMLTCLGVCPGALAISIWLVAHLLWNCTARQTPSGWQPRLIEPTWCGGRPCCRCAKARRQRPRTTTTTTTTTTTHSSSSSSCLSCLQLRPQAGQGSITAVLQLPQLAPQPYHLRLGGAALLLTALQGGLGAVWVVWRGWGGQRRACQA